MNLNSIDNKGSTPLHWAAFKGFEQSVNFLSVWSKKLDIQDENGKCTPLHLAVISGILILFLKKNYFKFLLINIIKL